MGGCFVRLLTVCDTVSMAKGMDCINGLSLEFTFVESFRLDLFLYAREHRIRSLDLHSKSEAAAI